MNLGSVSPRRVLMLYPRYNPANMSFLDSTRLLGKKATFPPLGLVTVAALLPSPWEIRLIDLNIRDITEEEWDWAEIVMVSGMVIQMDSLLEMVREAKKRGKIVAAGGPSPTSLSKIVLDAGCDFLVKGEGENNIGELVASIENGKGSQIIESEQHPNLEESPLPRYDLLDIEAYSQLLIQTTRGCPFDCEFCDIVSLFGRVARHKPVDQVIRELDALYDLGWRSQVLVCDDNFIGNRKYTLGLMEKWIPWSKEHGEPFGFYTQTSMNLGSDPEMIDLLTEANFFEVLVGVETPDTDDLKTINKKVNLQLPMASSVRNITRNGLTTMGSFIIGIDNEKPGAGERISSFIEETNIPTPVLHTMLAHPNTRLWDRLEREGRLKKSMFGTRDIDLTMNFIPTRPEQEIISEYIAAYEYLYKPARFVDRVFRHIMEMRPTRRALAEKTGEPLPKSTVPQAEISFELKRKYIEGIIKLFWVLGVRANSRWVFWKHLLAIMRKNPSRLARFLFRCGLGISLINYTRTLRKRNAELNGNRVGVERAGEL